MNQELLPLPIHLSQLQISNYKLIVTHMFETLFHNVYKIFLKDVHIFIRISDILFINNCNTMHSLVRKEPYATSKKCFEINVFLICKIWSAEIYIFEFLHQKY